MATVGCLICGNIVRTFPSRPRKYCSSVCYGISVKGIQKSPSTQFKKDEHRSTATEFKKGQSPHNKGNGSKGCKLCGKVFGAKEGGKIYCSTNCLFKDDEFRKKMSEVKKGQSSPRKGVKLSEEQKQLISASKQGIDLEDWTGYTTSDRSRAMCGQRYQEWRQLVFERDNFTCQVCKTRGGFLHADHIIGWVESEELRYELNNGQTLCYRCHFQKTFGYLDEEKALRWGVPSKYRQVN